MAELLLFLIQVAFTFIGCVLEALGEFWSPDFDWFKITPTRVLLGFVILLVIIFWFSRLVS
jgi:hypothetical protein